MATRLPGINNFDTRDNSAARLYPNGIGPGGRDYSNDSIDITGNIVPNTADGMAGLTDAPITRYGRALPADAMGGAPVDPLEGLDLNSIPESREVSPDPTMPAEGTTDSQRAKQALGVLDAVGSFVNAQNAYTAIARANNFNISMLKNQAQMSIANGLQRSLYARSAATQEGESAAILMAAQGQDVNAQATQKLEESYDTIGIYNGLQAEVEGIREAMGYELQASNLRMQTNAARNQRDLAAISSIGKVAGSFL